MMLIYQTINLHPITVHEWVNMSPVDFYIKWAKKKSLYSENADTNAWPTHGTYLTFVFTILWQWESNNTY